MRRHDSMHPITPLEIATMNVKGRKVRVSEDTVNPSAAWAWKDPMARLKKQALVSRKVESVPQKNYTRWQNKLFPSRSLETARALLAWLCQQVWKLLAEPQLQQPGFCTDQDSKRARMRWCIISNAGPPRLRYVFHLKLSYSNPVPSKQTNNWMSKQTTPWERWLIWAQRGAKWGGNQLAPSAGAGLVFPYNFHPVCHCYQGFTNSERTSGLV